jgi:choline dehydrogenase-like flavoprotein
MVPGWVQRSRQQSIFIGSGAGGGTLAYRLAPSGKKILLIERGPFVRREKENWNSLEVNARGRYNTKELWRDVNGGELHPHTNYYVSGNTKFYGAALFRLREQDFGEIKHHGGISPAWPISYDELEPYYAEAERIYHVHGQVGEDPTEPRRSGAYPYPAIRHESRIQQLSDDFAAHGLKPFHTPLGAMLDERSPQNSACIRCGTCDGFPCLVNAKGACENFPSRSGVVALRKYRKTTMHRRPRAPLANANGQARATLCSEIRSLSE